MATSKHPCRTEYITRSLSVIDSQLSNQIKFLVIHKDNRGEDNFLITRKDFVYSFGENRTGQIGLEHVRPVFEPTIIRELCGKRVCEIECMENFTLALTESRSLYIFGMEGMSSKYYLSKPFKPLEISIKNQSISDIDCANNSAHILTRSGQIYWFGRFNGKNSSREDETKINISNDYKIISISCGADHLLALTSTGKVFSWGANTCGQLGLGRIDPYFIQTPNLIWLDENIKKISCGSSQSLLLTSDKQIYSFGEGIYEPRLIDIKLKFKDIYCFNNISMAIDEKDRVNVWGIYNNKRIKSPKLTKFKSFQELINGTDNICTLKPLEQFEIFKKNPLEKSSETISKFFNNPENNDLKFKIIFRVNSDQFEYIYGHKCILEESSEYFKTMFASNWSENETNEIEITDYSYEAYYQYIRCFYVQFFNTKDFEILLEILSITEQYLDINMKVKCEEQIKSLTNLQNVCSVYCCAVKYNSNYLRQFSLDMILENNYELVETDDYKQMDPTYVKELLNELFSIES